MTPRLFRVLCSFALIASWVSFDSRQLVAADENAETAAIQAAAESFVKDFNSGKTEGVVAHFLPKGELIDEEGNIYRGSEELQKLFANYFAKFPGATLGLDIQSIRVVGDGVAIEEGTRYLSTKTNAKAQVRYVTMRAKTDGQWRIASTREFYDEPAPQPSDRLATLAWLVGNWVSEDSDAAAKISYRWSDDKNFLLGEFESVKDGRPLMKSTQRIGWDPLAGKVRSWLFDADGGFSEGSWTLVDDGWVIKSQATLPDGTSGSAMITFAPKGNDQFTIKGTDRIVGDGREDDFELTITRAPPAGKSKASAGEAGSK